LNAQGLAVKADFAKKSQVLSHSKNLSRKFRLKIITSPVLPSNASNFCVIKETWHFTKCYMHCQINLISKPWKTSHIHLIPALHPIKCINRSAIWG